MLLGMVREADLLSDCKRTRGVQKTLPKFFLCVHTRLQQALEDLTRLPIDTVVETGFRKHVRGRGQPTTFIGPPGRYKAIEVGIC